MRSFAHKAWRAAAIRVMRGALLWGAFLVSLGGCGTAVSIAPQPTTVKYGIVADSAASVLAAAYTNTEDAYCVTDARVRAMTDPRDTLLVVLKVVRAQFKRATSTAIFGPVECPSNTVGFIHTHPTNPLAGINDCNPSRTDWRSFAKQPWSFEGIVCSVDAHGIPIVRFMWPEDNPLKEDHARDQ
jgi:hypothetical protein